LGNKIMEIRITTFCSRENMELFCWKLK